MKDEEAVFFWSFVEICSCSFSFPVFQLLFNFQTAILITFSYGIFQVWIAIIFDSFNKYAKYLPILAARGDKADHCWYHFNQIQAFKFGWYHLPCGEPISACASFVNLLSQFASNMLCDFNMLPMPFSQPSNVLECPISPFLEWLRALLTQLFSNFDEIRWDLWADCADWAEVERTPGWPETGTVSH